MYVSRTYEYQNPSPVLNAIEVRKDKVILQVASDFDTTVVDEIKAGAVIGMDRYGLFHHFKTAKVVEGGSANAPRIDTMHLIRAGDAVSDGDCVLEVASVAHGDGYDTLTFVSGGLSNPAARTVLYQSEIGAAGFPKPFIYDPVGVAMYSVAFSFMTEVRVVTMGTVSEANLPQYVNNRIKSKLLHIRFI